MAFDIDHLTAATDIDRCAHDNTCRRSCPAEAASSAACSGPCQYRLEDVGIIAIVMANLKVSQIHQQIFLVDVVLSADYNALEQRPEQFDVVCAHLTANAFILAMVDRFVPKPKMAVARILIGHNERYVRVSDVANKAPQYASVSIANDPVNDVVFALNRGGRLNVHRRQG